MKQAQFRQKLRESTDSEIEQALRDERKNLFMNKRDSATKQLEDHRKLRETRKNIARILTVLRERELESMKGTK